MTDFEETVIKFIGRQEEATKNIKEDVKGIVTKLNGVDIQQLDEDVKKHNKQIAAASVIGAISISIIAYTLRGLF